jgi:hypothetical protein
MSLVVTWFSPDFIGIVCDGRISRRDERGNLVPIEENSSKAWRLSERIVLASTGSSIGRTLFQRARAFADSRQDDPDLFKALAEYLPATLRALNAAAETLLQGYEGAAVMLLGYDALQERMRILTFIAGDEGIEVFEESLAGGYAIGNKKASPLAAQICERLPPPTVDGVLPLLEHVAILVANHVPSVNKNLRSGVILRPGAHGGSVASKSFPGLDARLSDSDRLATALADGSTFARPLSTRISAGKPLIDFSEAIHLNKNLDNVPDGSGRFSVVNGAGLKAVASVDGANKALIDFSQGGHSNRNLDNVPDGAARFSVVNAAGQKGVSAVDGANKALIDFSQGGHTNKTLDSVPDGTRAAWTSATQKNAAVDASGNLLLKNIANASGLTNQPATSSTTYAVIPEMTQTITTKGNKGTCCIYCSLEHDKLWQRCVCSYFQGWCPNLGRLSNDVEHRICLDFNGSCLYRFSVGGLPYL